MSVPEIDVDELARLRAQGATLVDVRNPDEWEESRVPGRPAHPPRPSWPSASTRSPDGEPLYVICAVGGRSAQGGRASSAASGVDAVNVAGGTKAWMEAGYPIESGPA